MKIGTLAELRRYPVKSMGGELLAEVDLGPKGLPGDRAWAVRDEVRGGIRGAKKIPALMRLQSRYPSTPAREGSSPAEITLPDGSRVGTGDADVNERLSKAIDHSVSLWPLMPADALDHYRRGAPSHDDMLQELRSVFGREADEPLPDLGAFPPEILEFESPPGTYFDAYPLLLMTDVSLASLQACTPDSEIDVRRFRPNLLLAATGSDAAFPENAWVGKRLRIGDATLKIEMTCPRCVMTTHGFEDLPKDPGIMRSLVKNAEGNLGVYASVESAGRVRVNDSAELLP